MAGYSNRVCGLQPDTCLRAEPEREVAGAPSQTAFGPRRPDCHPSDRDALTTNEFCAASAHARRGKPLSRIPRWCVGLLLGRQGADRTSALVSCLIVLSPRLGPAAPARGVGQQEIGTVFNAMFFADRACGRSLRLGFKKAASRRRADRRLHVVAEVLRLEARCMLSGGVPIRGNPVVRLKEIFWYGGTPLSRQSPFTDSLPSPEDAGAAKTITITNYGTTTIYPFLRTENTGKDPHSNDKKTKNNQYYDPQDLHAAGSFASTVGYANSDGSKDLGLPSPRQSHFRCRWSCGTETMSRS